MKIDGLMNSYGFKPNKEQKECIEHVDGPLFISAGPGSGKTRVLLWRTVNLIACHNIQPEEIFLATFTEKAAKQLKEGLRSLLSFASLYTKQIYDISNMNIGTAHSICRNILNDRRFSINAKRPKSPALMDALGQFFFLKKNRIWNELWNAGGYVEEDDANLEIANFLSTSNFPSKFKSIKDITTIFNRFSEEDINITTFKTNDAILKKILKMYSKYLELLENKGNGSLVDFSTLQKLAYQRIFENINSTSIFKHIIVDEYQDTNAIQEKIYFHLAQGAKNICVVGDDDQALYRFRGATVENLVQFPERCETYLKIKAKKKFLNTNYRSKKEIVQTYTSFIDKSDWSYEEDDTKFYRVHDKEIKANSTDTQTSVVISTSPDSDYDSFEKIAETCYQLRKAGKVEDYNQIAFLFPSVMGNAKVQNFEEAFVTINEKFKLTGTKYELKAYAPRAKTFLDTEEAIAVWGLFITVFDRPHFGKQPNTKGTYFQFFRWMESCRNYIAERCAEDKDLLEFLNYRKQDIETIKKDYTLLVNFVQKKKWDLESNISSSMANELKDTVGISGKCKSDLIRAVASIKNRESQIENDKNAKEPYLLHYIIKRVTSLDWSVLDFFYQCMGFKHFKKWFDLAEKGTDEGPIVNLAQISKYLARFMEEFSSILSAPMLLDIDPKQKGKNTFQLSFLSSFTYGLYRQSETEVEDQESQFPKGRLPFLTIHQSKGLEFPIVVLGSLNKGGNNNTKLEEIIREGLKKEGEPIDRIKEYDTMRLFYVALSRAKNLLILNVDKWAKAGHPGYVIEAFRTLISEEGFECLDNLNLKSIPESKLDTDDLGKNYSYTGDFLHYLRCPRQYMIVRKYEFAESRSQTMLFGSLVHQTIEDLHYLLMRERGVV